MMNVGTFEIYIIFMCACLPHMQKIFRYAIWNAKFVLKIYCTVEK